MAVPKKKPAKSASRTRYSHFQSLVRIRLQEETHGVNCPSCGALRLSHCVCPACGMYKGRQVLQKKKSKETTRVQA
ncbi:50S ribosomal protein L32 [Candidatus Peregrinibacteria bacterium]|nr:MAG: 50S ribosomal protein L32 [Candidatus Peregrinibacteria bacterium]